MPACEHAMASQAQKKFCGLALASSGGPTAKKGKQRVILLIVACSALRNRVCQCLASIVCDESRKHAFKKHVMKFLYTGMTLGACLTGPFEGRQRSVQS